MATYSQAIKISNHIETTTSSTGTQYTAPANGYAIIQMYASATATIQIGGKTVYVFTSTGTLFNLYIGPNQVLSVSANSGTVNTLGVDFINAG